MNMEIMENLWNQWIFTIESYVSKNIAPSSYVTQIWHFSFQDDGEIVKVARPFQPKGAAKMAFQPNGPTANGGPGGGGPPPPMFFNPAQYSSSVAAPPGPPPPPSQPSKQQPQQPQSMVQYITDEKHPSIMFLVYYFTYFISEQTIQGHPLFI